MDLYQDQLVAIDEAGGNPDSYAGFWKDMGTRGGKWVGLMVKADIKSIIWYSPVVFDAYGYAVPGTWDELGIRADGLRAALNLVAYEAHRDQPSLQGTHDIRARDLAGVLYELSDKAKTGPDAGRGQHRIIAYLTDRAGLLIERAQASVYTFPHRTFQEYLAACHLADEDFPFLLAKHLRQDDERWREATLLAAAKAVSGSKTAVWNLVGGFCPDDYPLPEPPANPDWYAALRAAQALVETEGYTNVPDRQRGLMKRLRSWLDTRVEGGT